MPNDDGWPRSTEGSRWTAGRCSLGAPVGRPQPPNNAASAGIYHGGADGKKQFPRIQLLTIEGLLGSQQRAEHPEFVKDVNFKKAKREVRKQQAKPLFDDVE